MSEVKTNKITSLASNNDITLDPDGTGDVVVASGHKLGLGTTSPARQLTVSNSGAALLLLESTGDDNGQLLLRNFLMTKPPANIQKAACTLIRPQQKMLHHLQR